MKRGATNINPQKKQAASEKKIPFVRDFFTGFKVLIVLS
jgi:hypothetical protein